MERKGKTVSIFINQNILFKSTHKKLSCISCHVNFDAGNIPHKEKIEPIDCKMCHKDAPARHTFHPQILKAKGIAGGIDVSCKQCHGTHDVVSPRQSGSKFNTINLTQACGDCHTAEKKIYITSAHYKAFINKVEGAPTCLTCHKNPIVRPSENMSAIELKKVQEKLCLSCHQYNTDIRDKSSPSANFVKSFEMSVHGKAITNGNDKAAGCIDCHTPHNMKNGSDPTSSVNRLNLPNTCGKCHGVIAEEYKSSIHGVSVSKGNMDAPVCTNCHGEHNILKHNDPKSPVAFANLSRQVCSPCHGSVKLNEKYGIATNRIESYDESYHGLAVKGGSLSAANCASCHGAHDIKPSSDPTSRVNKRNLAKTCGRCHPGANQRFAEGFVHLNVTSKTEPALYWISTSYIILIIVIIGGMFIHNIADFIKKSRRRILIRKGYIHEEHLGHHLYLRMSVSERIQHISMAVSFMVLVITGFMLRFPDAWWVVGIRGLSQNLFEIRSVIHRTAAVAMVTSCLYHLVYVIFTKRGRSLIYDLLPRFSDLTDAIAVFKYNFGFSKTKPKFGRFTYIEKSEYWALVWGTIVMTLTGVLMWFDNTFIGLFSKLGYDIARTIHYYEAWLAFLAIVVWHFYFIIFNPDAYPMNLAWLTGTLSESEMMEEHPLELLKIMEDEEKSKISKLTVDNGKSESTKDESDDK